MEVESHVCFLFLTLSDVIGHEHKLITMDPDCVRVETGSHLVNPARHFAIDDFELTPIVNGSLLMICRVNQIVHIWSDKPLVEP